MSQSSKNTGSTRPTLQVPVSCFSNNSLPPRDRFGSSTFRLRQIRRVVSWVLTKYPYCSGTRVVDSGSGVGGRIESPVH